MCQALSEGVDGRFRRAIDGVIGSRQFPKNTRDKHELSPTPLEHGRQQGVTGMNDTAQVRVDHGVMAADGDLVEGPVCPPASVVDEDVDGARSL